MSPLESAAPGGGSGTLLLSVLVLGYGNTLRRDDGAGAVAARLLAADPRLARPEVEVPVLSALRKVASRHDIEIGTHGIVLEKDDKAATFLPQVPVDEGWTLPETLSELSKKAGLPEDGWREGARLFVFTGQVFGED